MMLRTYAGCARAIVEKHGGVVEKFIGDAVVAVFGFPRAHDDDAERAVLTALAIAAEVPALEWPGDVRLAVRLGINTGETYLHIDIDPGFGETLSTLRDNPRRPLSQGSKVVPRPHLEGPDGGRQRESSEIHARGVRHGLPQPFAAARRARLAGLQQRRVGRLARAHGLGLHLRWCGGGEPDRHRPAGALDLHLAVPGRDHRPRARRPGAVRRPADHGREHGGPGRGHGPQRPRRGHLHARAGHEPRALRPAPGAGGASARHRAHAARAHRRQRRLQLDGERQRAHRPGAHRRAARRRRPGAGNWSPRGLHTRSALSSWSASPDRSPWPSAWRASR